MKEEFITDSSQEGGGQVTQGHMGKQQLCSGGRRVKRKHVPEALLYFLQERTRRDRGNSLVLASLNNVSGL